MEYSYIKTEEELKTACNLLKEKKEIAVDLECENNMHAYGSYISLIQVSSKQKNYIFDIILLKNIDPFLEILKNPEIVKVFHDISFDFRILDFEFKVKVKNIFDTQHAADLLSEEKNGLTSLLEKYFQYKKKRKFQRANWSKRPLQKDLLDYASHDTYYLLELKQIFEEKLKEAGRYKWALEDFKEFEKVDYTLQEPQFWDLKNLKELTDVQRGVAKELHSLREKLAKQLNKPAHYIYSNKSIIDFARYYKNITNLKKVHPYIKQNKNLLQDAIQKGTKNPLKYKKKQKTFYNTRSGIAKELIERRNEIADKYQIKPYLLLSNNNLEEVLQANSLKPLAPWKQEILKKHSFLNIEKELT